MSKITHAATRAAFGTAIDGVLKYVSRDRKEHMMKLVDLSEKFLGDTFRQQTYDCLLYTSSFWKARASFSVIHPQRM